MALNIGIKCKKIPDLFGPINEIPFIQQMKDNKPGNKTTYESVRVKGKLISIR